jgi:hypothetical protein
LYPKSILETNCISQDLSSPALIELNVYPERKWFSKEGLVLWAYNENNRTAKREQNMKRLVDFPLEDGSNILVEIEETDQGGLVKASLSETIVKAQQTLEKSMEKVKPAAQYIIQQIRGLHDAPDEVQVSFGLKLSADAGAVLASASAEANYTVTLKWAKEKEQTKPEAKPKEE